MPAGGARPGAGRPPGSKNGPSVKLLRMARASGSGELPHEFLLRVARGEPVEMYGKNPTTGATEVIGWHNVQFDERLDAAKACANYYAPKLATIEHKGSVALSHEEQLDLLDEIPPAEVIDTAMRLTDAPLPH